MSIFDTLFGGGQGQGYKDMQGQIAQEQEMLRKMQQEGMQRYQPYYDAGTAALPQYQSAIDEMKDPQAYYNKMLSGYQESPQAKQQIDAATQAAQAAAAAGGMGGSSSSMHQAAQIAQQGIGQDQQQYLQNVMGIHGQYLGGLGGLEQQGLGTAGQMNQLGSNYAQMLGHTYDDMGRAQYGQDVAGAGAWNRLLGRGASALSHLF